VAATPRVESLRPAAMQSRPVRLPRIFENPARLLQLIRQRAPYLSLAQYHNMQDTLGGARARPVYRGHFADEFLLQEPCLIQAAGAAFQAQIVKPFKCIVNLNGPMGTGGIHVDLPVYRGFAAPAVPVWLLMNMAYSGLFHAWLVPVASGLIWFWRGVGGEFEYWADGPQAAPQIESPPLWNCGLMSDNEFMWHGVRPTGTADERAQLRGKLNGCEKLHYAGGAVWEIRDAARIAARLAEAQLRISLLWKAYVFLNEEHLRSFQQPAMDLTHERVAHIYRQDLTCKGVAVPKGSDLLLDAAWRATLESTYRSPFHTPAAADSPAANIS
jgi:hypothetical protein